MNYKFAGFLNILCGLIYILIYVGFFFTFIMDQMQGNGIIDYILSLLIAIACSIPLAFLVIPAFMMFVIGREMFSNRETMNTEKVLIGLTMFLKILFCVVFGCVGWMLFMGMNEYYSIYGIFLMVGAILLCISWVADFCALIKNKIQR